MATLFVVATPIGNLEDMTLRAITVLSNVDMVLAEDTRVTRKLLDRYNISKPLLSYHQHSKLSKIEEVIKLLKEGKNLALVSDAGTPGVNDPGSYLVRRVLEELPETKIVPLPGANAALAALSVSGFPADQFTYLGFPPHKKGRQTFFKELAEIDGTIVFYESKHRIEKTLTSMSSLPGFETRRILVGRELTKQFETMYRGTSASVLDELKLGNILGEFVIVVEPSPRHQPQEQQDEEE